MEEKTAEARNLPLEIWFRIFHYVRVQDTLQLSLVCRDFTRLLQSDTLWQHYCLRESSSLSCSQITQFPSCRDLYRDILKPFSWSLDYTFMCPGPDKMRVCKMRLQDRALVIAPAQAETRDQVLLKIASENGKRKIEKLVSTTGHMVPVGEEEAQQFIKRNVVVYFFDRYMKIDHKLLQSSR